MYSIGGSPLLEPAYIAGDPPMIYRGNRGGIHPYNNVKTHGICGVLNPTKRVFIPSTIFFSYRKQTLDPTRGVVSIPL